jgi:hypothetical protein
MSKPCNIYKPPSDWPDLEKLNLFDAESVFSKQSSRNRGDISFDKGHGSGD